MTIAAEYRHKKISSVFYLLFILLSCLIAYWPLTFNLFSLKNDALNYFLPVRHQISEAIISGKWPFWSPYFNLGYPLHGDMQSGVWNPFVQFFSLFGAYTLPMLQYETLLYIYLSGVGMFFLLSHFKINKNISAWASIAYMLCGFNSDSAQFLNWISGASFLPFVFLFYYRTLKEQSLKQAIFCGFFLYLLFVTAYPADFIITAYLLFFYLLVHLYHVKFFTNRRSIVATIKSHLVIAVCFGALSLPAIISFVEFLPLSERGGGASYRDAMSNPFHPFLLSSYVSPLGLWRAPFVSHTDPLERNSYFGIITFLLALTGFFIRIDNKLAQFCKWAFVISLVFSFGEMGGLRSLCYYLLPLMNTFRHPANAKLFTIFLACVLAAFSMQEVTRKPIPGNFKRTALYIIAGMLVLILLFAFIFPNSSFTLFRSSESSVSITQRIKDKLDQLSFLDLTVINFIIQLPFLVVVYFNFVKNFNLRFLLIAGIVNCILFTMLFQPLTVVKKDSVTSIQSVLNKVSEKGYPLPDLRASLGDNSKDGEKYFKEIGASNMYNKKVGRINYRITPSNLNIQNEFWANETVRNELMSYPMLYRADTALLSDKQPIDTTIGKRIIIMDDPTTANLFDHYSKDQMGPQINVLLFSPERFDFEIDSGRPGFYCLFQNFYPRWRLYIDGLKTMPRRCNIAFMGFDLKPGKHFISFKYRTADLAVAFYVNLSLSLLIIILGIVELMKLSSSIGATESAKTLV